MEIYNNTFCVYIHTNKTNGKVYVGQTCQQPEQRWRKGWGYVNCSYFYNAIQKYGWDNFEHEVIASNLTSEEANNFEAILIKTFDAMNPKNGYNLRSGGENGLLSEQTKNKIKAAVSGENAPMLGKHHTEEAKEKISKSRQGKYGGEKNPNYGKHASLETRQKMSDAAKKRCTDEWRKQHSERQKGRRTGKDNHNAKAVICLETKIIYAAKITAAQLTGANAGHIGDCCRDERKSAGGFRWRFVYDTVKRNGVVIPGAITLGITTKEQALEQLNNTTK